MNPISRRLFCLTLLIVGMLRSRVSADDTIDFGRDVRPIFAARCLKCHGAEEPEGGLDLTRREPAFELGAVVANDAASSSLLERVASDDESIRMPPTGERLSPAEIETLRRWIDGGAEWSGHWAYQPIRDPVAPEVPSAELRAWCRTPVDQFIAARLEQAGLTPSSEADRLTLIRRVTFDLCGVPPTPEEVAAFQNDTSPHAWESCVERLLASPRYGERLARHWMDLVHFAETHGQDQDRPRENSWPYRDYLIHSFNDDKPFDRFAAEQIAGDALFAGDPDAIAATGLLAAGPWDESSLRDIREDSIDRIAGQYLDRDDIVTTVMSTFTSTSVHCARCHDHKFDPITQHEYYGLQAVFAGIDKAERAYDPDPSVNKRRAELAANKRQLEATYASDPEQLLDPQVRAEIEAWEHSRGQKEVAWHPLECETIESRHGATLRRLDDGSILSEGERPETDIYVVESAIGVPRVTAVRLDVLTHESLPAQGPGRCENGNLHLNEIHIVLDTGEQEHELRLGLPYADFNQQDWGIEKAIDRAPDTAWGIHPAVGKPHFAVFPLMEPVLATAGSRLRIEMRQTHGRKHLIGRFRLFATDADPQLLRNSAEPPHAIAEILATTSDRRSKQQHSQLAYWYLNRQIDSALAILPPPRHVYCGTNQFKPDGSFKPANTVRAIHVLNRGLVAQPGEEAQPQALSCIAELPSEIVAGDPTQEGERRKGLALWVADRRNPLTWRSIANRVWQFHFDRALVDTPNDFGQMGSYPTHPELLDWMASYLQRHNGSLKDLHRVILQSAVYRQASQTREECAAHDADNRLLWRMNRRRLDAESIRDALLVVSGTLDQKMGGPSVRQFIQSPGVQVTPTVDYVNFDVDNSANYRRSVYRFIFRTVPDPFMEALDCPDASQLTPKRNASLTALQALATLNDKLMIRQSELLAESLQAESKDPTVQIASAYTRLFGRSPSDEESRVVAAYVEKHGLANACRFLFNTNEFLFVD